MHRGDGPPHWKLMQIQKSKNPRGRQDERTYYTATQGILPRVLRLHDLCVIIFRTNDRKKKSQTTRQTETHTHKLDCTPLGSFVPQNGDKCITTLDPHTGNQYKYKNLKRPADYRKYKQTEILYCHSGALTLRPAAAYAACNYRTWKWFPKSDADEQT